VNKMGLSLIRVLLFSAMITQGEMLSVPTVGAVSPSPRNHNALQIWHRLFKLVK